MYVYKKIMDLWPDCERPLCLSWATPIETTPDLWGWDISIPPFAWNCEENFRDWQKNLKWPPQQTTEHMCVTAADKGLQANVWANRMWFHLLSGGDGPQICDGWSTVFWLLSYLKEFPAFTRWKTLSGPSPAVTYRAPWIFIPGVRGQWSPRNNVGTVGDLQGKGIAFHYWRRGGKANCRSLIWPYLVFEQRQLVAHSGT